MTGSWALIKDNVVFNVVVWDGEENLDFGDGVIAVEYSDDKQARIGDIYKDGSFVPPPLSDEQEKLRKEALIANNNSIKESLQSSATQKIVVWQTKLLMGRKLSATETQSLNSWMDYIDLLDAVDPNTPDEITWPTAPEA